MSTTAHLPLWQWSATSLATAIREKRLSSQDVIQAHLDRIEAVNPIVNAVTVVLKKDALRAASEADKKIVAGENVGPLHGVPITVKEGFDVVGSATTHDKGYRDAARDCRGMEPVSKALSPGPGTGVNHATLRSGLRHFGARTDEALLPVHRADRGLQSARSA